MNRSHDSRQATGLAPAEEQELHSLVSRILTQDTVADRAETLAIAFDDPDAALLPEPDSESTTEGLTMTIEPKIAYDRTVTGTGPSKAVPVKRCGKVQGDPGRSPVRKGMSAENLPVDWAKIEVEYRTGIRTLRAIADEQGISHVAILKRARAEEWPRDLGAKIRAKAAEKVTKSAVTKEVTKKKAVTEQQTVEINAEIQYHRIMAERADVGAARELVKTLFAELAVQTGDLDAMQRLAEIMDGSTPDRQDRLNEVYRKIIALPGRVDSAKKLSDAMSTLFRLERQVFGIDERTGSTSLEDTIRQMVNNA